MKNNLKIIYFLVLILLSSVVYAQTVELRNHEPIKVNGRTFELSGRGDKYIYIEVDGDFMKVSKDEITYENGISIQAIDIYDPFDSNPLIAIVSISMDYICGNDVCEIGEKEYCCTDCNCTQEGYVCLENTCIDISLNVCNSDLDCNDSDACTTDICTGVPLNCTYKPVTECVQDDGCCPKGCNVTVDYINNDYDCFPEPECWTDFDCDDNDSETFNLCDKRLKFCKYETGIGSQPIQDLIKSNETNIDKLIEDNNSDIFKYVIPSLILVIVTLLILKHIRNRKLSQEKL